MVRIVHKWSCVVFLCLGFSVGCSGGSKGPELAMVEGVIMVDGKPGADLQVVFEPQRLETDGKAAAQVGSGSIGMTDAEGRYALKYQGASKSGAVVGKHVVRISRMAGGGPAGGADAVASIPIPDAYNAASILSAEVAAGDNTKDFQVVTQ